MERGRINQKKNVAPMQPFTYWLRKNCYYHSCIKNFFQVMVPAGYSVLHINGKNGYIFDAIQPSYGVCLDNDEATVLSAQSIRQQYRFYCGGIETLPSDQQFDYIILTLVTMETYDIQLLFAKLHKHCHERTRIIIESYSYWWKPILWITQKFGLRRPTNFTNWVSQGDLRNFLHLAGFEMIKRGRYLLFPFYIPLVSTIFNKIVAHVPLLNRLCLNEWLVARAMPVFVGESEVRVSVVIPCRNERGNIEEAVRTCPIMGKSTELIFVEGNSSDDTLREIHCVMKKYQDKQIKCYVQDGIGKADAVRKGFAHASGDIVMILDADLTTPPQELQKFFYALLRGSGEFINGSRLVYGMESGAMTIPSFLANYFFSIFLSWVLDQRVKDTLCGTKVLWRKDYEKIQANRKFFGTADPFGDFDLLFGAARFHLKIVDMPVHYKRRVYGVTQIKRFLHVWFLIWISLNAMKKIKFC